MLNYLQLGTWIIITIIFVLVIGLLLRYIDDEHDTFREERY
ncbi:MAG: hypothetical protein KatS3mg003_2346 [Candidatus Nitrosocaldaceae archaeon]|nr:MAG: hypothetical protein KatS3mg003_0941 [Candidatus Nitrosocaldaceae archaeon]GIU72867.1 MAG: hypothetical protein KatS3mg003_2346 [Candidatus Nitrosocaldaceae archaeon]